MARSGPELADVFRRYGATYRQRHDLPTAQRRVMTAIERCRTAALGGHVDQCDQCGHQRISYNSCRNRHCPKCQSLARAEWLEDRRAEILDTQYFHVVFTVPEEIATIAYQNKEVVYGILFRTAAETLRTIAADPAPGCRDRLLRRAPHLGPESASPSPPALRRDRRRIVAGRQPMDRLRAGFFLPVKVLSRCSAGCL